MHEHPFYFLSPANAMSYMKGADLSSDRENLTIVPDDLLLNPGTIPVFTIRDPQLTVSSTYRLIEGPYGQRQRAFHDAGTSGRMTRQLYDWFVAHGIKPVIVDADDYMTDKSYVRDLCSAIRLDPEQALFSWQQGTEEEMNNLPWMFQAAHVGLRL